MGSRLEYHREAKLPPRGGQLFTEPLPYEPCRVEWNIKSQRSEAAHDHDRRKERCQNKCHLSPVRRIEWRTVAQKVEKSLEVERGRFGLIGEYSTSRQISHSAVMKPFLLRG